MTTAVVGNPTFEETLAHYGVKGMRWGVRDSANGEGKTVGKTEAKKPTAKQIKTARTDWNNKAAKYRADVSNVKSTTKRGTEAREKAMVGVKKQKIKLLNDPDRATSLRSTRSELATTAVLAIPTALFAGPSGVATVAGTAATLAGKTAYRKNIERKQRSGAYNE